MSHYVNKGNPIGSPFLWYSTCYSGKVANIVTSECLRLGLVYIHECKGLFHCRFGLDNGGDTKRHFSARSSS